MDSIFNQIRAKKQQIQDRLRGQIEKSFANDFTPIADNDTEGAPIAKSETDELSAVYAELGFEKAHQDGDIHPKHPDWVWVSSAAGGKGDWRKKGGRTHSAHSAKQAEQKKQDSLSPQAKGIIEARKKNTEREVYNVMNLITVSDRRMNDRTKVKLDKTPKGNWRVYYDGRDTGLTIGADQISETSVKQQGWVKEDTSKGIKPMSDTYNEDRVVHAEITSAISSYIDGDEDKAIKTLKNALLMAGDGEKTEKRVIEVFTNIAKKKFGDLISSHLVDKEIKKIVSGATGEKTKSKSKSIKIDTDTIDDAEYNRQLNLAKKADKESLSMALGIVTGNANKTKKQLEETIQQRPGAKATISKLQKDLTHFLSQKKAIEEVMNSNSAPKVERIGGIELKKRKSNVNDLGEESFEYETDVEIDGWKITHLSGYTQMNNYGRVVPTRVDLDISIEYEDKFGKKRNKTQQIRAKSVEDAIITAKQWIKANKDIYKKSNPTHTQNNK